MNQTPIFENLPNTRDLCALTGADGRRIRSGKLIRSGQLANASAADLRHLAALVDTVVDFRTETERAERPDPEIPGVRFAYFPPFTSLLRGITKDARSNEESLRMLMDAPEKAERYMQMIYEAFVDEPEARRQYRNFLRLLLEPHEKAVLFHCTAGKDRAGFAAALVLALLGTDPAQILEDYLRTNEGSGAEAERLGAQLKQMGAAGPAAREALRFLSEAQASYLEAAWARAEALYGSFDAFLREGLGIGEAEKRLFRTRYLLPLRYRIFCGETAIGLLEIDGERHRYMPDPAGTARAGEKTPLFHPLETGQDWGAPIPFFANRLQNAKRFGRENDTASFTDPFRMIRID